MNLKQKSKTCPNCKTRSRNRNEMWQHIPVKNGFRSKLIEVIFWCDKCKDLINA